MILSMAKVNSVISKMNYKFTTRQAMNLLAEYSHYSEIEVRSLFQVFTKEFGWRKCWYKLLDCKGFQQAQ